MKNLQYGSYMNEWGSVQGTRHGKYMQHKRNVWSFVRSPTWRGKFMIKNRKSGKYINHSGYRGIMLTFGQIRRNPGSHFTIYHGLAGGKRYVSFAPHDFKTHFLSFRSYNHKSAMNQVWITKRSSHTTFRRSASWLPIKTSC